MLDGARMLQEDGQAALVTLSSLLIHLEGQINDTCATSIGLDGLDYFLPVLLEAFTGLEKILQILRDRLFCRALRFRLAVCL